MSVKSSLEAVCGSLPMERLEQFVEEDNWYDDDDEGNESDSEDKESENDHDPEESILPKEVDAPHCSLLYVYIPSLVYSIIIIIYIYIYFN